MEQMNLKPYWWTLSRLCWSTKTEICFAISFSSTLTTRHLRVQLVAASFVPSRYVNDINDIVTIGWLPVRQWRDFHVLKLVHKALHSPSWPSYVPLDTVKHLRSLLSEAATRLIIPMERGTFQDSAAKLFNALPANIRNCSDFIVYCREVNAYLLNNICK